MRKMYVTTKGRNAICTHALAERKREKHSCAQHARVADHRRCRRDERYAFFQVAGTVVGENSIAGQQSILGTSGTRTRTNKVAERSPGAARTGRHHQAPACLDDLSQRSAELGESAFARFTVRVVRPASQARTAPEAKGEGGEDDRDGREGHRRAGHHRMQVDPPRKEEAHREGNTDQIVDGGPDEVDADLTKDAAREIEAGHDVEEVRLHEDDVGGLHGDVGTGVKGNANVGGRQGRRVIDAVANLQKR